MLSYLKKEDQDKILKMTEVSERWKDSSVDGNRYPAVAALYLIKIIHELNEEIHELHCK